METEIQ